MGGRNVRVIAGRFSGGRAAAVRPEAVAWSVVLPCAIITAAAILWLGPFVGSVFAEDGGQVFWPSASRYPEPTEHGRYLVALLGPLLLAGVVLATARRKVHLSPPTTRVLAGSGRLAVFVFLALCLLAQNDVLLRASPVGTPHNRFFTLPTLLVAVVLALLTVVLPRRAAVEQAIRSCLRETRARGIACFGLAVLSTAACLLSGVNSDGSIGKALANHLIPWTLDESFAVLDGRTPLVDFHTQYAQLWPYFGAATMRLFGTSIAVWTTAMACMSGAALLALYAVLRRITRSSVTALLLYLPLMTTGFFFISGTLANRFSPATNFNLWPMRYAGPYLLAWLTARHLDGRAPRHRTLLCFAGGLVLVNNVEFGAGAFGGTLLALACAEPVRSWRRRARVVGSAVAGLAAAIAAFALLTLMHSGDLPRPGLLSEFPRLYAVGGWALQPMPTIGLHLAVYATFGAALATAVVRWASGRHEAVLTGMLAWSGTFGLGAGVYYVGRSERLNLIAVFSPWCLALVLLTIVVVRALAARDWRRPTLPELAVLFGFGLACASLVQMPTPWSQVSRLRDTTRVPIFERADVERFVAARTRAGERVAIIAPLGHRLAHDLRLTNVSPYSGLEAMPTQAQLGTALAVVRAEQLSRIFVGIKDQTAGKINQDLLVAFELAGYRRQARVGELIELELQRLP